MINFDKEKKLNFYSCLKEYENFSKYLPEDIFECTYEKFCEFYNYECGINPEVCFGLYLQNQVNKELCSQVNKGNIDLEIELIDKYMPTLEYIIRKKNARNDIDKEGIIIASIKTYDGAKLFSLHMLDILKKCNFSIMSLEGPKEFNVIVEEYISENKVVISNPNYYDELFIKFKVFDYINNEDLKRYAYLRYGHHNGIYFSNEDVMKILNIDAATIGLMYKKCLNLLKQVIDEKIDLIIELFANNSELGKQFTRLPYITKTIP